MKNKNLKTKTLSGMIWSFGQRFGSMGISFVSNIILARLLTPDDYGAIGMLMIFIAVANTFVDGGFGSALIQKKEPTNEDYSTIFWWNMFLSLVLYGVLYVCAPAVASFYDLPLLSQVLRIQGFVLILNALSTIQQNQLRKQLKFKRLASVTVVSAILSASLAIVLAYMGWGVWALVAQQLMLSGFTTILLWMLNKWYPSLVFSKESFKQLFGFGGYILGSNLINTLCNNVQGLLIGKFFSPTTLGYYTQAFKLEQVLSNSISSVVDHVSYPVLSELQDDNNALKKLLKKLTLIIAFISTPILLIFVVISEPIIMLLYSDKWLPSVEYLQILCVAGIAVCLQGISYYAVASKGKSKDLFWWTFIKRGFGLVFLVVGMIIGGIKGLMYGFVVSAWFLLLINQYLVSKHIGYSLLQQYKDLLPIYLLSATVCFICLFAYQHINLHMYTNGAICTAIFVILYTNIARIIKLDVYTEVKSIIKNYLRYKTFIKL